MLYNTSIGQIMVVIANVNHTTIDTDLRLWTFVAVVFIVDNLGNSLEETKSDKSGSATKLYTLKNPKYNKI